MLIQSPNMARVFTTIIACSATNLSTGQPAELENAIVSQGILARYPDELGSLAAQQPHTRTAAQLYFQVSVKREDLAVSFYPRSL